MILGSAGMIGSAGAEIGSAGLATPAVVVAVAASSTAIVHGSNVTVNAWENIWKDDAPTTKATDKNGRVNADGNGGGNSKTSNYSPDRSLPRDKNGNPVPDADAKGPHTQLGTKNGRNGKYTQAREFDNNGKPVKDIDFTNHGRPKNHTSPHQHRYIPNKTGGTPSRGKSEALRVIKPKHI